MQLTVHCIAVMRRQEVHELDDAMAPRDLAERRSRGRRGKRLREVTNCPCHLGRPPHGKEGRALYGRAARGGVGAISFRL